MEQVSVNVWLHQAGYRTGMIGKFINNYPSSAGVGAYADQITSLDNRYRLRLRSLQAVDEAVEALYNLLSARGILANTYIVFAGENGFHLGEHWLQATKGFTYDESIRVPPGELRIGRSKNDCVIP